MDKIITRLQQLGCSYSQTSPSKVTATLNGEKAHVTLHTTTGTVQVQPETNTLGGHLLQYLPRNINLQWPELPVSGVGPAPAVQMTPSFASMMSPISPPPNATESTSSTVLARILPKVFVVYGHDKQIKDGTELFLRRNQLDPILLDQQVNNGRTIIEKLEAAIVPTVACAIVLLTPDDLFDVGRVARARPNVLLELGWVIGKLGREKIIVLKKNFSNGTFDLPSDVHGVVYLGFSEFEHVQHDLYQELKKRSIL